MRRREFITLLGCCTAVAWPVVARGQQPTVPVIGFLHGQSAGAYADLLPEFRRGLRELGFIEGHNVAIEFRWAEGQYDRLPTMVTDLIRRQVNVIVASRRLLRRLPRACAACRDRKPATVPRQRNGSPRQQG